MRGIFTADWHIGPYRNGPEYKGVNERYMDIMARITELLHHVEVSGVKHLFFLGDLFRNRHPDNVYLAAAARVLKRLSELKVHSIFMVGNHDQARFRGQQHALSMYMPIAPNYITIVDTPCIKVIEDIQFFIYPYLASPQDAQLKAFLKGANEKNVLLMHGTVEGSQMFDSDEIEISDKDTISADTVRPLGAVFAGHIHKPQHFRNVWYPGALERLTFNDEPDERGFLDITIEDGKVTPTWIPVQARRMMTLHIGHIPAVERGELDVKGAIVRVRGADATEVIATREVLTRRGCFFIASIQTIGTTVTDVPKTGLSVTELVTRYAKKVKYEGNVESASKIITDTLNSVTE